MYMEQLRKAPCLAEDIRYIDTLPRIHPSNSYRWLVGLTNRHIQRHKEQKIFKQHVEGVSKPALFNIVNDPPRNTKALAAIEDGADPAAPFARRGRDPKKQKGGRNRSRSGSGSRTPGGRRKDRKRHGKSVSPACSAGGTYKFSPRGTQRKEKYKSNDICRLFAKDGTCKYGDTCKFKHVASGAVASRIDPRSGTASASGIDPAKALAEIQAFREEWKSQLAGLSQGFVAPQALASVNKAASAVSDVMTSEETLFYNMNTHDGDYDCRDSAEDDQKGLSADHLALAFKGKGKGGKGKGKGKKKKGRAGKGFSKKAPCKFWPLGTCNKGRDCPFYHSQKQFERRVGGIAAVVPP